MKIVFNKFYFSAALLFFIIEVFIALFIKDKFVRPYVGDYLVVILLYCFLKSFWNGVPAIAGVVVLLFSFMVEVGQYFQLVKRLGLHDSPLARTVIGTGFDWGDMLAYILGFLTILFFEKIKLACFG